MPQLILLLSCTLPLQSQANTHLSCFLQIYLFWAFPINTFMQYVVFGDGLISLGTGILVCVYVVACIIASFLFLLNIIRCMDMPHLPNQPSTDSHLRCSCSFFSFEQCYYEHPCTNLCVDACFHILGYMIRYRTAGPCDNSRFICLRNCQAMFQSGCTSLHLLQWQVRVPVSPRSLFPNPYCLFFQNELDITLQVKYFFI